jgi:3-oxoadipate enol-lactonase
MPYADNAGVKLWYEVTGDGETAVLTGGWGIAHTQFERVTPLLAREGFSVLNWNWRGVGNSDRSVTQPYSIELWTEDLEAVLEAAGVESAWLWGTSSGSLISLHQAARRPHRVKGVATWMHTRTDLEFRRAYLLFPQIFEVFG